MPRTRAQSGTKSRKRQQFDLDDGPPITPEVVRDAEQIIQQLQSLTLVEEDDVPLESEWHLVQIHLLDEIVRQHLGDPNHYYCNGNMFVYYSVEQARGVAADPPNYPGYKGPDFFVIRGVDGTCMRRYWSLWDEGGRYPDLVVELVSPKSVKQDKEENLRFYAEVMRVPEYFWYDPDKDELRGFRLEGTRYEPIEPNERGWLWSHVLQAYIGVWDGFYNKRHGRWLRIFRTDGSLVPTLGEEAEQERQRAEQERQRAEQAEAELQRLKQLLREKGIEL